MEWDIHCDKLTKRFLGTDHLLHLTETTSYKVVDGTNGMEQYLKCTIRIVSKEMGHCDPAIIRSNADLQQNPGSSPNTFELTPSYCKPHHIPGNPCGAERV
jgi:hypothetical protein